MRSRFFFFKFLFVYSFLLCDDLTCMTACKSIRDRRFDFSKRNKEKKSLFFITHLAFFFFFFFLSYSLAQPQPATCAPYRAANCNPSTSEAYDFVVRAFHVINRHIFIFISFSFFIFNASNSMCFLLLCSEDFKSMLAKNILSVTSFFSPSSLFCSSGSKF
jgi:hypothetical protein